MGLTDTKLRSLKLPERPRRIFDGDGLYIELRPNGGKWWRFKYRFDGKEKSLSFGTYPEVPLARARHAEARQLLAAGTDPSAARQQAKKARQQAAASTLETVPRDWLAHRASAWTPGTRLEPFRHHLAAEMEKTKHIAVKAFIGQTNQVAAEEQVRQSHVMTLAARAILDKELEPRVRQFADTLQRLVDKADRPWEAWLIRGATVATSTVLSGGLVLHFFGR